MKLKCVYNFIERLLAFRFVMLITKPILIWWFIGIHKEQPRTMSNQHGSTKLWSAQRPEP